jgi:hypothetical protein
MCRTHVPTWPAESHRWCLKNWTMYFVSGSYLLNLWNETLVKCLAHQDDVQNPCSNLAGSRSPVVFEDWNHVFHVRFISFKPLEWITWNFDQDDVQNAWSNLAGSRSRSLKIWTMYFMYGSYLLNPWNEFYQTLVKFFIPSRRCAEPMFQPGRLKVKVISCL